MAGLGRSQGDLRFPGPLGLAHRTQQHPVPSFFFFLSEAKEASAAISREGQWIFFFFLRGQGGGYCCVGISLVVQSRSHSVAAVCRLLIVVASLVEHGLGGTWASVVVRRLSSCSSQALAQKSWRTRLAAPRHVGGFRARDLTGASCIGRRVLYH